MILTGDVGGDQHPGEHGALRQPQHEEGHGAVGQTHGHAEHAGQADGEEETAAATQPADSVLV